MIHCRQIENDERDWLPGDQWRCHFLVDYFEIIKAEPVLGCGFILSTVVGDFVLSVPCFALVAKILVWQALTSRNTVF